MTGSINIAPGCPKDWKPIKAKKRGGGGGYEIFGNFGKRPKEDLSK